MVPGPDKPAECENNPSDIAELQDVDELCETIFTGDDPCSEAADPLMEAAFEWHKRVGPWLRLRMRRGLQHLVDSTRVLSIGTMFSGTDISERLVAKLHKVWKGPLRP